MVGGRVKMDRTQERLEKWCSAEGIQFKSAEAGEEYKKRARRIADAIQLKVPDRVPIVPSFGMFPALDNGYTVDLGGDISEPGIQGEEDIAVVPTFDIHPLLINQDSREYRFANRTSTDDHAIHAVGIKQGSPHTWFLIKDSGGSAHRGNFEGYYFYRDDFIKLKMLCFTVHKDAVKDILAKFNSEE